jgi:hypothetical protein
MTRYTAWGRGSTGATILAIGAGLALIACGAADASAGSADGRDANSGHAVSQVRQVTPLLQDQHDLVQAKLERWASVTSVTTDRQDLVDAKRGTWTPAI